MQWTLFLLVLMGQCPLFTCRLYEYHYIRESKTWDDAQTYCREKYIDLATVSDMTDMERLCNFTESQAEAWIGLHSYPGMNRTWYWSLPGLQFNVSETRWKPGQPDDAGTNKPVENCGRMDNQQWSDYACHNNYTFICYSETKQSNNTFHFINISMTWPQAQSYCRQHYTDLVSGLDQLDDPNVQNRSVVWIGLFRDTWRWSDGSTFNFRNWENVADLVDGQSNQTCATVLNSAGKWGSDYCTEQKPFFCYKDSMILINKNMTWVDALSYCRQNHHDLISITNLEEQTWVQEKAKNASSDYVWLGLRYTCTLGFWFWVGNKVFSFANWAKDVTSDGCDMSAVMETRGQHQWFKQPDNQTFNFICSTH